MHNNFSSPSNLKLIFPMALANTFTLIFLFTSFIIFTISSNALDPCASNKDTSDLSIVHIYGKCSPFNPPKPSSSWFNTVLDMASKDSSRLKYLSTLIDQKTTAAPIASGQHVLNLGNYVVQAKLGTPGQLMYMVFDTSSDAAFVPCSGCSGCASSSTMFSPNASSTYCSLGCSNQQCMQVRGAACPAQGSAAACMFNQSYGGDSTFSAFLAKDSLALGAGILPNYAFGCINAASGSSIPPQGLLGLGRGSMSLLSQSGSLYKSVFSYCLPSFKSFYFSGSLKLGPSGQPGKIPTTPLLSSPHRSSLYYVNLTGISVGRVKVKIAPELLAFDPTTGSGTIIDSGTVITRFVEPVYNATRDEFRKQVKGPFSSLGAFDTCFEGTVAPAITMHFEGLDLTLPMENSLIHSSAGSLACLSMAAAPSNVNSVLNIIANLQQQNMRIMFDVANSRVGIKRELCN